MNRTAWTLEWQTWRARKRALVIGVIVPLALVTPIALSDAPALHAATVYTILFTLFGLFGGAIPWIRDADSGWLQRVLSSGTSQRTFVAEKTLAAALADAIQLAPSLAVICIATKADARLTLLLLATLLVTLIAANTIGFVIACVTRSIAEAALVCTISGLLLLHLSGVFRPPTPGTISEQFQRIIPFHYLAEALRATTHVTFGTVGLGDGLYAGLTMIAILGLTIFDADRMLERLGRRQVF
jgi:ABC-type transport system involved in multi-copper enzyme maturation permease subunit